MPSAFRRAPSGIELWHRACRSVALLLALWIGQQALADEPLHVGSKRFTESYVLGEILTQTARQAGTDAEHLQGLGNTAIVFAALSAGKIDLYPEYLNTIEAEILHQKPGASLATINQELGKLGLGVGVPLGFNNTYALAMTEARSHAMGVRSISALAEKPDARLGLSHEFLDRSDGWPGLAELYHLPQRPFGIDHGLAYEALQKDQVDVIDIYSTDAQISQLHLAVLNDDRNYFPRYDAVLLYRLDVPARFPKAWQAIQNLQGTISEDAMIGLNKSVEIDRRSFAEVAGSFLAKGQKAVPGQSDSQGGKATSKPDLWQVMFDRSLLRLTWQHLFLVAVSVFAATLIGIPLGILAAVVPKLEYSTMAVVGVLQTVPSLALLAILISLLGRVDVVPALIALFLYALLPIVRNTCTGILGIEPGLRMAAKALGLRFSDTLIYIELPLARPVILAGLKTASVMSVGTATLAAFIGAGGYGERIVAGLAVNDTNLLLAGAIPAAALALLIQGGFELLEHKLAYVGGHERA